MELKYYVYEIRQSLPKDWPKIDDRIITRLINEFRTVYIKNQYNQNKSIDKGLTQTIDLQMEPVDQSTVHYINTDFRILRSRQDVPKIIKTSHRDLVTSIRNAKIISENYNYITKEDAIYAGNGRVNKKEIFAFIDKDIYYNLYIKLKKENPKIAMLTTVSLQAIFEDPLECIPFHTNSYIDFMEYEYPMTDTIWGYIKANILRDGLGIIQATIQDDGKKEV
ncbi:MAG: hypothetical protein GY775_19295 [Candidatus Scalindua sp.]|nr:hypothetical protein [Candidatus Scalindua sp.]